MSSVWRTDSDGGGVHDMPVLWLFQMLLTILTYSKIEIDSEVLPGEISLQIFISDYLINHKNKKASRETVKDLTEDELNMFIDSTCDQITSVVFSGGDTESHTVNNLAAHIREEYPELKIGWFSSADYLTLFTQIENFDFIRLSLKGPKKATSRLYKVVDRLLIKESDRF